MLLEKFIPKMNAVVENLQFGTAKIVIAVTDATNPANICVYTDNGFYCSKVTIENAEFTGPELLKSINFDGLKLAFDDYEYSNHTKWCSPKWLIHCLIGDYPKEHWEAERPETKQMIRDLRKQLI